MSYIGDAYHHMAHRWTEFTEPGPTHGEELYCSLSKTGRLTLSRKSYEAFGRPEHIVLLYDDYTDSIGLRPAPAGAINAYRMQPTGGYGAYMTTIGRFLKKKDIRIDHTCRFPGAHIEADVLVLDLHTRVPAFPGGRGKKK